MVGECGKGMYFGWCSIIGRIFGLVHTAVGHFTLTFSTDLTSHFKSESSVDCTVNRVDLNNFP